MPILCHIFIHFCIIMVPKKSLCLICSLDLYNSCHLNKKQTKETRNKTLIYFIRFCIEHLCCDFHICRAVVAKHKSIR